MKKFSLTALLALLAAIATVAVAATTASAAKPGSTAVLVPEVVTGTVAQETTTGEIVVGTFAGNYTINRVINDGGELAAVGTLTGTITTTATGATQSVERAAVTIPLSAASGGSGIIAQQVEGCEILDMTLGPLDLDLLGLVIHLDVVHLNITAEPGEGNLLGNLLCAVAGLLDPPTGGGGGGLSGLLNQIVALLNQILGQL